MTKYPHGLTLRAVCDAIDAYRDQENDDPEAGMLAAFEILLTAMAKEPTALTAPAINLAELVPDEVPEGIADKMEDAVGISLDKEDCQYLYSVCRAAMLRKIEGAK